MSITNGHNVFQDNNTKIWYNQQNKSVSRLKIVKRKMSATRLWDKWNWCAMFLTGSTCRTCCTPTCAEIHPRGCDAFEQGVADERENYSSRWENVAPAGTKRRRRLRLRYSTATHWQSMSKVYGNPRRNAWAGFCSDAVTACYFLHFHDR